MKRALLLLNIVALVAACKSNNSTPADDKSSKAVMYYGGDIITMEGDSAQYAEAVATKEGKIIFVGSKEEAMKAAGDGHEMVDLAGFC
jgi:hypothetical protein